MQALRLLVATLMISPTLALAQSPATTATMPVRTVHSATAATATMPARKVRSATVPVATAPAGAVRILTEEAISAEAQRIYTRAVPSLVVVQYTWESELGRREVAGPGIVVSEDGTVITPLSLMDPRIPDEQMKDFKVIVPRTEQDNEELEATFLGRDERSDIAFVRPKEKRQWTPLKFVDHEIKVGDRIWSVGVLPKIAGYKAYIVDSRVSALMRGEVPQVLAGSGLASMGSPVFNADGEAIGLVSLQSEQPILLNEPKIGLAAVSRPPVVFVAASALLHSLATPPQGEELHLPWIGVMQMIGLEKEVAEYFGLGGTTAVQIGDSIPGGPAYRAGVRPGQIITKINGKPIERGDQPEELPAIVRRQLLQMLPGDNVTLSLLDPRTRKTQDVTIKLEERPKQPSAASRYYAEDLGFSVRELVFVDAYARKLEPDTTGVVVALVRPQSAAQTARMENNDMVVELNGKTIKKLDEFVSQYKEFREKRPTEAVVMVVLRDGRNQTIRIEPPQ